MDNTALVFGVGEYFSHSLQHSQALVANDEFHTIQHLALQPLEEIDPAGLVFFHPLGCTQNLTVSILIYRNRNQNRHIIVLFAPVAPQIDTVHIDMGIFAAL